MPPINLTKIYSVSSEDPMFPATNLLTKISKKWKCKPKNHQQTASVIFQLDNPVTLNGIDIGNEHSTYITVLVGRPTVDDKDEQFQEILLASSFMTPMESRQSINTNRVRCFSKNSLVQSVASLKCTLIKVVCSQPYNHNVQFGLAFIKFYGEYHQLNKIQRKPIVSVQKQQQSQSDNMNRKIPKFGEIKMREESPDSEKDIADSSCSSLFSRWKQSKDSSSLVKVGTAAAAIRDASAAAGGSSATSSTPVTKKIQPFLPKTNKKPCSEADDNDEDLKLIKETTLKNRNHNSRLLYDEEDEKPNLKLEKLLKIDQEKRQQKDDSIEKKTTITSSSSGIGGGRGGKASTEDRISKKFTNFLDDETSSVLNNTTNLKKNNTCATPSTNKTKTQTKRTMSPINTQSNTMISEPKQKKIKTKGNENVNKPFDQLLDGVVLVISGIQNPLRSEIRDKALQMGAKYKPDWQNNISTHLICAFKNTPKYNQVHGHGKIVKKEWILDSFDKKKKLPWRRFALDENDKAQPDSEEEVEVEVSPSTSQQLPAGNSSGRQSTDKRDSIENINPADNNDNEMQSSGSDTEDEINRVIEKNKDKPVAGTSKLIDDADIYNQSTDEEESTDKIHNKSDVEQHSPIEPLPKLFNNKIFYLSTSSLSSVETIKLKQIITAYCGRITKNADTANFIISNKAKQLPKSYAGEVVRPLWVFECNDTEHFLPTKRYKFE